MYVKCKIYTSCGQNLVHGEGTPLNRVGPYRFGRGGTLDQPSSGYRFGYRFRVCPYWFCSDGNPTTLSILLWSYLIVQYSYKKLSINLDATEPSKTCSDHRIIFYQDLVAGCGSFMALDAVRS